MAILTFGFQYPKIVTRLLSASPGLSWRWRVTRSPGKSSKFGDKYPSQLSLTTTGWELDREFLVELDKAAWDSVVKAFCGDLPDPVIEDAVRKLPQPHYKIVGETLAEALKSRRDALPEFASEYYKLITRQPEIQATDQDEVRPV